MDTEIDAEIKKEHVAACVMGREKVSRISEKVLVEGGIQTASWVGLAASLMLPGYLRGVKQQAINAGVMVASIAGIATAGDVAASSAKKVEQEFDADAAARRCVDKVRANNAASEQAAREKEVEYERLRRAADNALR